MSSLPVMIESPYSGDIEENVKYAYDCLHDSYFNHNEAPFASHLQWTKLDPYRKNVEHIPDTEEGRKRALEKCRAIRKQIGTVVFYTDRGMSSGMKLAEKEAQEDKLVIFYRTIYN